MFDNNEPISFNVAFVVTICTSQDCAIEHIHVDISPSTHICVDAQSLLPFLLHHHHVLSKLKT